MLSFVCSARKKNSKSGQVDPHFYLPCQTFLLALPDIVLTLIYINYFELECMGSPPYSMLNVLCPVYGQCVSLVFFFSYPDNCCSIFRNMWITMGLQEYSTLLSTHLTSSLQ